jgi:hypothetical protein
MWELHQQAMRDAYGATSRKMFQNTLKSQRRELAIMDIIANAAKHGGAADARPDRPHVTTILSVDPTPNIGTLFLEITKRDWSLKVTLDGQHHHFAVIAERAYGFWHTFVGRHCGIY